MQKISSVHFEILTGATGCAAAPRMSFNGFELELERESGGTGPGETFVGSFDVHSVPHQVRLLGPGAGQTWQIAQLRVQFVGLGVETREHVDVELAGDASLDLWGEASESFDV